ncbi:MAG: hypothetical protein U0Q07_07025 [Acidimicrobiales bacterium]
MTEDHTTTGTTRRRQAAAIALAGATALATSGCVRIQGRPDTTNLTIEAGSVAEICVDTSRYLLPEGPLDGAGLEWRWDLGGIGLPGDQLPSRSGLWPSRQCRAHEYDASGMYHGEVGPWSVPNDGPPLAGAPAAFTVDVVDAPAYQFYVDPVPGERRALYAQLTHAEGLGPCATKEITLSTPPPNVAPVGTAQPVTYLAGQAVVTPTAGAYDVHLHIVCERSRPDGTIVRVDRVFSKTATST